MTVDIEIVEWLKNQKTDNSYKPSFSVGQVGQLAPTAGSIVSYPKNSGRTDRTGAGALEKPPLAPGLTRATECNTLSELENMLKEFCQGTWTILDRAALSNAYTPIALKLIDRENVKKAIMLEHLASLVWKSN